MNVSVLKKVGLDIVKIVEVGGEIVAAIAGYGNILNPILASFLPANVAAKLPKVEAKATTIVGTVDDAIKAVEGLSALGSLPKDQRLDTATSFVLSAFSDVISLDGHDVADPALLQKSKDEFVASVKGLTQSRVDFLNSLKPKS